MDEYGTALELRRNLIDGMLNNTDLYGIYGKTAKRNIKSTRQKGVLPSQNLLLAIREELDVDIFVHYGGHRPLIYSYGGSRKG